MNTNTRVRVAKGVRKNVSGTYEVRKVINELSTNNIKIESVETCRLVLSDFMTPSSR